MLSHFSLVWLFVTLWTIACQASLSMRFSRQEYWSGYHFLLQGIFPTQGLNLRLNWTLNLEPWLNLDWIELALAGRFFTTSATCKLQMYHVCVLCPTVCDPMDCNLSSSSVHGISQARILEWLAISSSRESSWPRDGTHVSCGSCIAGRFSFCCCCPRFIANISHCVFFKIN